MTENQILNFYTAQIQLRHISIKLFILQLFYAAQIQLRHVSV